MIARSIIEMRDARQEMFCPGQVWYETESFAHLKLVPPIGLPTHLVRSIVPPPDVDELTDAVSLVALYLSYPHDAIWHGYLWTADADSLGQRVYIGGTANGRGLEIHRHLKLDHRWSVPVWR